MFKDEVVAITGAGSGIGRALAIGLAPLGARLALADIDQTGLLGTAELLPAHTEARCYHVDVSLREAVFAFADEVTRDFGAVHMVVNNAGISVIAHMRNLTIEEIEKVLDVNLWGVIYGTKAFLPGMLAQKDGCIVNISSVFGLVACPGQIPYTMSKFAVRGLTEALWMELAGTGVRAVLVHPGGINTNISRNSTHARNENDQDRRLARAMLSQMTTSPEDCAREIVKGLLNGDKRLLVGSGARTLYRMSRLLPDSYDALIRRKLNA
ncbi:short-chain type dehydrogenase/reductase (plasmid) [Azospirillum sp. B510]|uniref:SDR family NAD(P)-dependent oxidoreductase n=1 Tax=Azospirillum sp. (strain B510) TaxID=137722 RepID=UPI0001C4B86A|nr:SDR family oxidoreductase [Azospirillum sp. B510]BAI74625.1 short-chain type dehydrogenase/reductase [Azospirillum sp. B510]